MFFDLIGYLQSIVFFKQIRVDAAIDLFPSFFCEVLLINIKWKCKILASQLFCKIADCYRMEQQVPPTFLVIVVLDVDMSRDLLITADDLNFFQHSLIHNFDIKKVSLFLFRIGVAIFPHSTYCCNIAFFFFYLFCFFFFLFVIFLFCRFFLDFTPHLSQSIFSTPICNFSAFFLIKCTKTHFRISH